jgi:hypothetical protein
MEVMEKPISEATFRILDSKDAFSEIFKIFIFRYANKTPEKCKPFLIKNQTYDNKFNRVDLIVLKNVSGRFSDCD